MKKLIFAVLITVCLAGCQSQPRAEKANSENSGSIQQVIYNLNELDQRPTPIGFQKPPGHPDNLARRGMEGQVVLQFVVNTNGDVQDIKVISSNDSEFEQLTIEAVQQWKFLPGLKDGKAVYSRMQVPISFNPPPKN